MENKFSTSLEFSIECCEGVENELSFDIDFDIFLVALIVQLIRNRCLD